MIKTMRSCITTVGVVGDDDDYPNDDDSEVMMSRPSRGY